MEARSSWRTAAAKAPALSHAIVKLSHGARGEAAEARPRTDAKRAQGGRRDATVQVLARRAFSGPARGEKKRPPRRCTQR